MYLRRRPGFVMLVKTHWKRISGFLVLVIMKRLRRKKRTDKVRISAAVEISIFDHLTFRWSRQAPAHNDIELFWPELRTAMSSSKGFYFLLNLYIMHCTSLQEEDGGRYILKIETPRTSDVLRLKINGHGIHDCMVWLRWAEILDRQVAKLLR